LDIWFLFRINFLDIGFLYSIWFENRLNDNFSKMIPGCESRLLVIGISVAIGKEQGLELWSDGVLEWWKRIRTGVLASGLESLRLGESNRVLGLKAEIDLIFTLLPLVMRDPTMVYLFPLYQPFIHPLLSPSRRLHNP
jgi:hypothetical protein